MLDQNTDIKRLPVCEDDSPYGFRFWSRKRAEDLALMNGIFPLTGDHWKVIDFVRGYYLEYGFGPSAYQIYKATGFRLQHLLELFPGAITWNAHYIAGLPNPGKVGPTGGTKSYFMTGLSLHYKWGADVKRSIPFEVFMGDSI